MHMDFHGRARTGCHSVSIIILGDASSKLSGT